MNNEYLQEKIIQLQKAKRLKNDKKRFLELAINYQQNKLTLIEIKELKVLIDYEKSIDKVKENKKRLLNVNKIKKLQINKKRNYKLLEVANLLIISDLVDVNTGDLLIDKNALLGALFSIKNATNNQEKMTAWKNKAIQFLQTKPSLTNKDIAEQLPFDLTNSSDRD